MYSILILTCSWMNLVNAVSELGYTFQTTTYSNGVAAYFTPGVSASSICSLANGDTCKSFYSTIFAGVSLVLSNFSDTNNQSGAYALADPASPQSPPLKRSDTTMAQLQDFWTAIGMNHTEISSSSSNTALDRRDSVTSLQIFQPDEQRAYNMSLYGIGTKEGSVSITPTQVHHTKRDAPGPNPSTAPENDYPAPGPGFKITFRNYNGSVPISEINGLATSMTWDWVNRSIATNGSRYFAVFSQSSHMISALEIIPEMRGYGVNEEDPNSPCGPLDCFACLTDASCYDTCEHPNGACQPLGPGDSPSVVTTSSTTSSIVATSTSLSSSTSTSLSSYTSTSLSSYTSTSLSSSASTSLPSTSTVATSGSSDASSNSVPSADSSTSLTSSGSNAESVLKAAEDTSTTSTTSVPAESRSLSTSSALVHALSGLFASEESYSSTTSSAASCS